MATCHDWIADAEADLVAAERLLDPATARHACFCSQQAAVKALKALLLKLSGAIPRIHDLHELLVKVRGFEAGFPDRAPETLSLRKYYTVARYPDMRAPGSPAPSLAEAQEAVRMAGVIVQDGRQRIA